MALRTLTALGPAKMRVEGVAVEVADGGAEDGNFNGALVRWRAGAEAGAADGLGDVELVVQGDDGGGVRRSGRKMAAKYMSLTPAQSKGPLRVSPPETFLGAMWSSLAVAGDVELGAGVGLGVFLVAEAAGPGDEGADGGAVAEDLDVGVEDVGLVEGEGLGDLVAPAENVKVRLEGAARLPVAEGTYRAWRRAVVRPES